MTAHPATFYHYEPLLHYDIVQARSGARAEDAVRTLKDLMHCNYTSLGELESRHHPHTQDSFSGSYLQYGKSHQWLFSHNQPLWSHCTKDGPKFRSSYCWKPEFLNR